MLTQYPTTLERSGFQNPNHTTLPKMANLFINELLIQVPENFHEIPPWMAKAELPKTIRIPLEIHETGLEKSDKQDIPPIGIRPQNQASPIQRSVHHRTGVRALVRGISHHFNNLLMGIWGNLSLARLHIEKDSTVDPMLNDMESLIEDGAYLTHLILGYLGERRIFAQRVRLKQLTQEVQLLLKKENPLIDMMSRLEWTDLPKKPVLITGCTGLVFEQFIEGIHAICEKIPLDSSTDPQFTNRLNNIERLVQRGLFITHRMLCSTGNISFRKRWINLNRLVLRCTKRVREKFPNVIISFTENKSLPLIPADRRCTEMAIEEVMNNACSALKGRDGRTELYINRLQDEPPEERCGVNTFVDCIVLTVRDNGKGIPESEWKNIFKPFFTYPPQSNHVGLGLTAANGIIRSHGGHIQLQSKSNHGSTFKIYLPTVI